MKNKNGFTLIEVLVVIAIIAILSSVATIAYTSYVRKAEEKEKTILHSTLEAAVINYQINHSISGDSITLAKINNETSLIKNLSFKGKTFSNEDLENSSITVIVKGNKLSNYGNKEQEMIKDGVCKTNISNATDFEIGELDYDEINVKCKTENNVVVGSNEKGYCMNIVFDGVSIINDSSNGKMYCR